MTELALTSLASPLLGDYAQPRNRRPEQTADTTTESRARREPARDADDRVISGEVIPASEDTYSHLNTASTRFNRNSTASESGLQPGGEQAAARRFNLQSALQTYAENQAFGDNQQRSVQVSGIIDEYV